MSPDSPLILEVAMEVALPKDLLDQIAKKFGPEKARHCAMSTSVGGIGPLLRERIFEQGDAGINVIGVTLLYDSVWVQSWHEWGQINLQRHPVGPTLRSVLAPTDLGFELTLFDGTKIRVAVWQAMYGKSVVYFLDAPEITDMVYPGPKDAPRGSENPPAFSHIHRLKQSWLVGRGALALSKKLNRKPDIAVLSETPTFFVHHRLVHDEFQKDEFFNRVSYIFNDHTPLEYAHPMWDTGTLDDLKVDRALYINTPAWIADKKLLDVTSLLVGVCDGVFGVARKHRRVMQAMPSLKLYSNKIKSITNGVRLADWQAPELKNFATLSDDALLKIKTEKRNKLIDWAWRRCNLWPEWATAARSKNIVVWTRRITPYKRLDTLLKLIKDPASRQRFVKLNLIIFIGGRIHQQDNHAQDIVYDMLDLISKDKQLESMIVFVDNFNVWEAPLLFQGADATIMMADDTREASATGFMKAQMNGAAVIATNDGAVPEFVKFEKGDAPDPAYPLPAPNGFQVPYIQHEPTSMGLLDALEAFDRTAQDPRKKVDMIRAALSVTPYVDVARTVAETKIFYADLLSVAAK